MRPLASHSPIGATVVPDITLKRRFLRITRGLYSRSAMEYMYSKTMYISEFLLSIALCNTVVVSSPPGPRQKRLWPSLFKLPTEAERRLSLSSADSGSTDEPSIQSLEVPSIGTFPPSSEPSSQDQLCYAAESPDELALVHAARAYYCNLQSRSPDQVTIEFEPLGTLDFQLLHILPFDAVRKRMSVVVRHPILNQVVVYTKGADSVIMTLLEKDPTGVRKLDARRQRVKENTQKHLDEYARNGLRTLCVATKVMTDFEYKDWLKAHYAAENDVDHREELLLESAARLESNLTLLGATGVEDRLQEGVPETIASLRKAGMTVWMLTGDKQETAVNIAHSCKLLEGSDELFTLKAAEQEDCEEQLDNILEEMKTMLHPIKSSDTVPSIDPRLSDTHLNQFNAGLIIDGPTLAFALNESARSRFLQLTAQVRAVICCRATPLQKSEVVKAVRKELRVMTLAIEQLAVPGQQGVLWGSNTRGNVSSFQIAMEQCKQGRIRHACRVPSAVSICTARTGSHILAGLEGRKQKPPQLVLPESSLPQGALFPGLFASQHPATREYLPACTTPPSLFPAPAGLQAAAAAENWRRLEEHRSPVPASTTQR